MKGFSAVYRKEMRSYAVSMTGAVTLAVLLLIAGFVTRYINYFNGYGSYAYSLQNMALYFYAAAAPLLTMRTFAEEYRQKTDALLYSAPIRPASAVLGKYAALVTFLLIPVAVMGCYALRIFSYGSTAHAQDTMALFLFFLMGCAYAAVGLAISALTENQIASAIISLLFVLLSQMAGSLKNLAGGSGRTGALALAVCFILILGGIFFAVTKRIYETAAGTAALLVAAIALFLARGDLYDGRITKIIGILDFRTKFFTSVMGRADLTAVLFFLTWAVLGVTCAVFFFSGRVRQQNMYRTLLLPVLILIGIFVNLIVGKLPQRFTVRDLSQQNLYTVSAETENAAAALEGDVTFYFITTYGSEDRDIEALLGVYDELSPHIFMEKIDRIANPQFTAAYTDEAVSENSVIVSSQLRTKVIPYASFYPTSDDDPYATYFDGEGQLTSALFYVTDARETVVACTSGHGEPAFDTGMQDVAAKMNLTLRDVNLLAEDLENADALVIFAPAADFTAEEAEKVTDYLNAGGNALIVTMQTDAEMPNFQTILTHLNVTQIPGYVMEGQENAWTLAPYLTFPIIAETSALTSGFPEETVLCALAQGISTFENESEGTVLFDSEESGFEGLTAVSPILISSEYAFSRTDVSINSTDRQEGEEEGPFALACVIEKDTENGLSRTAYFTTPCIFSSTILSQLTGANISLPEGNRTLLARTFSYITERDDAAMISPKRMGTGQLLIPEGASGRFGVISMAVLPLLVLAAGFFVWYRRRRR